MITRSKIKFRQVRFQVLTAASMKIAVFWVVAQCSLVEDTDVSEAAGTSETSVNFYQSTRCNNPEDSHLQCQVSQS
jgi:hypothetical protein